MRAKDYMPSLYESHKILPSDIIGGDLAHPYGNTYYVKKSTDTDFDAFFSNFNFVNNKGRNTVYTTVTLALAAADAGDTIFICPGFYADEGVLNITQQGLRLLGPGKDQLAITGIKTNSGEHHLITVNANDVEIAGLSFFQNTDAYDAINVSPVTASFKCHIHHCKFDNAVTGEHAIFAAESPDILIENNLFRSCATGCVSVNSTRAIVRNNLFIVAGDTSGVIYVPNAGDRPDGQILDNRFMTDDGTNAIGIEVVNTPTAGLLFIDGNHFSFQFHATNKTTTKSNAGYLGVNYRGHAVITAT